MPDERSATLRFTEDQLKIAHPSPELRLQPRLVAAEAATPVKIAYLYQRSVAEEGRFMPKILIVEDNEENRDSLSRRLQRRGFEVLLAEDGKIGIETAKTEKPDLILMDMNLPEVDGWEATRQIRADAAMAHVPVIALTAHAMVGDRQRALDAGCSDYHTKPIEFAKLLGQIESMLKGNSSSPTAS